ncbi:MAG: response regulator [Acidimicrobiia bacterium]
MTTILVAADARWVREQLRTAFAGPGQVVREVTRGQDVRGAVAEEPTDLVVLDLQIGNMGGIATAIDLRLEESAGRLPHLPILLLLDREADRFLAARADVDAVVVKPLDPGTLRRAAALAIEHAAPTTETADASDEDATDGPDTLDPSRDVAQLG